MPIGDKNPIPMVTVLALHLPGKFDELPRRQSGNREAGPGLFSILPAVAVKWPGILTPPTIGRLSRGLPSISLGEVWPQASSVAMHPIT
jgi:hypothetical protein